MSDETRTDARTVPSIPRTSEISSSVAQDRLGELLDRVARGERVVITRYGKPRAVLVPVEAFRDMMGPGEPDLDELEREFDERFRRMHTAAHRRGVDALFAMSGREMGEAARRAATDTPE